MKITKKQNGIKISLTCVFFQLIVLSATAQTPKRPDFSGTWLLDTAASQFNGVPLGVAAAEEVNFDQHGSNMILAKLVKGADGASYYFRDTLGFDGKASLKVIPNTGANKCTKTTTMKLSDDGKLVFSANYKINSPDGNEQTYAGNEVCSLSADGNTLTLQRTNILPDRTERITAVYHKKK